MASQTTVTPLHRNTFILMYRVHGKWLLRFYDDLPSAIAEKDRIKRVFKQKEHAQVHIAWILV